MRVKYKEYNMAKKIDIDDDEFCEDDYVGYDDDQLETMVDEIIINRDPDDYITIDNLHLVVEWIKRKL